MASSDMQPAVCPDCGAEVPAGAKICPDCHARLDSVEELDRGISRRDTVIEPKILDQLKARDAEAERERRNASRGPARPRRPRGAREERLSARPRPRGADRSRDERPPREPAPHPVRARAADRTRPDTDESVDVVAKARRLQAERPARAEPVRAARPERPQQRDDSDTLDLPGRRSGDASTGALGLIAAELEDAIEGGLGFGAQVDLSDKLSIVSSLAVVACTLLPWSGSTMGIFVGATPLWLFAVAAMAIILLRQRFLSLTLDEDGIDEAVTESGDRVARVRRLNLLQILNAVGAVAYVVIVAVGLYLLDPRHLNLRFGWFVTLFFAMGLAYSGIARFISDALQHRQD